jgi:hypothetical protein
VTYKDRETSPTADFLNRRCGHWSAAASAVRPLLNAGQALPASLPPSKEDCLLVVQALKQDV